MTKAITREYKSGQECPRSGQWLDSATGNEITLTEGEVFPPSRGRFTIVDETRHRAPAKRRPRKPKGY